MRKNFFMAIAAFLFALVSVTISSCTANKCSDVSCQNGGVCNDGTCACANGHEGVNCQTGINKKFEGLYSGSLDCSSDVLAVGVSASSTNPLSINIDFSKSASSWTEVVADISSNQILITPQAKNIEGNDVIVSGSGTLSGSSITIYLTVEDASGSNSSFCTFSGSK